MDTLPFFFGSPHIPLSAFRESAIRRFEWEAVFIREARSARVFLQTRAGLVRVTALPPFTSHTLPTGAPSDSDTARLSFTNLGLPFPSCLLGCLLLFWVSAQQSSQERDLPWPPDCGDPSSVPLTGSQHWILASSWSVSSLSVPHLSPPVDGQSVLWGQRSLPRTTVLRAHLGLNGDSNLATNKKFRSWVSSPSFFFTFVLNFSHSFLFTWNLYLPPFNFRVVREYFGSGVWEGAGWSL